MTSVKLNPIAYIRSQFTTNTPAEAMRAQRSQLVFLADFAPGLMGLEPGQDILVLFFLDQIRPEEVALQLHPRHDPGKPLTGVFNTRSQFRPNPIGATVARIEQVEGQVVSVGQLDALDGTPVLDVKPYAPYFDADLLTQSLEVTEVASLEEARAAIDRLDAEIIRLLGHRADYVRQVAHFKQRPEDVPAPERYNQVMQTRRRWAEQAGLNPDVIEGMYKLLVDNFIKEEIELIQQREQRR